MNSNVYLDRTYENTGVAETLRRSPIWLVLVFAVIGFGTFTAITLMAGSSGPLLAAGAVLLIFPLLALIAVAAPQAREKAQVLAQSWTWWHTLWFLTYFSMLVFRIRDVGAARSMPLDGYALLRVVPEAIIALSLLIRLILRKPSWASSLLRGIPLAMALYCLACLASTAWSVNAPWTAYKSVEFLVDVSLMATIVASAETALTFERLMNFTLALYGLSLAVVWINLPIWPSEAMDGGRLTGVFPVEASNSVGTSGAVLSLIAVCRLMPMFGRAKDRAWYIFLLLFGFVSMVLSQTRAAEAAFFFGLLLIALFSRRARRAVSIGAGVITPLVVVTVFLSHRMWQKVGELALSFLERDQSASAIDSLSGRTAWWSYGIEQLMQHPLTGMGAYAAGRFGVLGKLGVGAAAMMHSDWIEIVIGTSFWGLIPFAVALIAAWWYLIRCVRGRAYPQEQRQLALEMLTLLGLLTMHSIFNDELSWHAPILYLSILGFAEFVRRNRKNEPKSASVWHR